MPCAHAGVEGPAKAVHDFLCPLGAHLKEWDMKVGAARCLHGQCSCLKGAPTISHVAACIPCAWPPAHSRTLPHTYLPTV